MGLHKMSSSIPKWNFDLHCTKQIPKVLTQKDFGYSSNEFAFASNFKILTPDAVKISLDIIKNDEKVKKNCRFNDNSISNRLRQTPNTYAYRNMSVIFQASKLNWSTIHGQPGMLMFKNLQKMEK